MKKEVIFSIVLILLMNFVSASIDVTYDTTPEESVIYNGYDCNDDCDNVNNLEKFLTKTGTNNLIYVSYPNEGLFSNYFYKSCFYPEARKTNINSYFNDQIISISLSKKSICESSISSVNIVGDTEVGSSIKISTSISSPFQKSSNSPYNFVPPDRQDYYKAETKVELLIDGIVKDTIEKNLLISTTENVEFIWIPETSDKGTHEIKIRTNVIDCQCEQPQNNVESSPISITISEPTTEEETCTDECTSNTCSSNARGYYICSDIDNDGCKELSSTLTQCPYTEVCDNGQCLTQQEAQKCSDGTPINTCSSTKPKYCDDNLILIDYPSHCGCPDGKVRVDDLCVIPEDDYTQCIPVWECGEWGDCFNKVKERTCIDINNCDTTQNKPITTQSCSRTETDEFSNTYQTTGNYTALFESEGWGNAFDTILEKIQDILFYQLTNIIMIIIALTIIILIIYFIAKRSFSKTTQDLKEGAKNTGEKIKKAVEKVQIKSVKPNELLIGIIKSLPQEEQNVAYTLMEGEGIRQSNLRKKTGLSFTRLEEILKKFEKREIIKKREKENDPKIYFHDMIK